LAQLSHDLAFTALELGWDDPWLLDNQARALVDLKHPQAAQAIWQRLVHHSDASVAETAQGMLSVLEEAVLIPLEELCARDGWQSRHLRDDSGEDLMARLLKEVIATREAGLAQLSHDLAFTALELGWDDPWLLDNQARALVHLERESDALALWRALARHQDSVIAATASHLLQMYETRVIQKQVEERCDALCNEGHHDQAANLLVETLLQYPEASALRSALGHLISADRGSDLLGQELQWGEQDLAVHERLLEALEARVTAPQN
jgi:hypothetical protein